MTGVGRYSPALGNETGRTLLESTVHMFFESTVQNIWRKETILRANYCSFSHRI